MLSVEQREPSVPPVNCQSEVGVAVDAVEVEVCNRRVPADSLLIAEAVGATLDHPDIVVETLDEAKRDRPWLALRNAVRCYIRGPNICFLAAVAVAWRLAGKAGEDRERRIQEQARENERLREENERLRSTGTFPSAVGSTCPSMARRRRIANGRCTTVAASNRAHR